MYVSAAAFVSDFERKDRADGRSTLVDPERLFG
jgi:hypothetical protein